MDVQPWFLVGSQAQNHGEGHKEGIELYDLGSVGVCVL